MPSRFSRVPFQPSKFTPYPHAFNRYAGVFAYIHTQATGPRQPGTIIPVPPVTVGGAAMGVLGLTYSS